MTQVTLRAYQEEIDHLIDEARFLEAFAHLRHILSWRHSPTSAIFSVNIRVTPKPTTC